MQLTTENNDVFINLWNKNKPDGFVHPMRKGVADIIFYALELAEYTVNFENDVLSLYDNQTNENLGNKSLKDIFDKAYSICDTDYPDDTTSRTFGFNILSIFENEELSPIEYKKEIRETLYKFYQTEKYFNTDEFLFNSIDYTTKNWVEIDNTYYEFEETQNMLSIGDSIVDLEDIYGENHFPDEAITDGKIKIFDSDSSCIDYLCEKHNLKDFEEVQDILMRDFDYPTKEVVEKVLPDFDNEQIKLLADIIEDQEINLEYITPLTFENIYFEIDKSKLTQEELEELNKIKEELSKPTVDIFKQSFDSFIMSLSEAASKSIQKDIENLKAKALYVFNVDNNEYTIVSKRDGENPFMVHKYYPENETDEIHYGNYDIDTYESAEKIAANRLINEQKEKYELINFIAGTREEEFNLELKNELSSVFEYLNEYSLNEKDQIELIDVKAYQYEGPSGKLKVLVEYKGNCREDDLFNLLHDDEENGQDGHDYEINGYKLDLNPIKAEKSGTISEYLTMLKNVEEKWPEVIDIVEVFRVNGVLISEEDKKDFETFFNYHMEINTQSFSKKNEKLYLEDEVAGSKELVDKEFLLGKLESYIQNCNDSNDEYLQVHKNLFSKYIKKPTIKIIYTKDSSGFEQRREYDDKGNIIHFKDSDGVERWYEYDEKGNVIHYKNSDGNEHWTEYDDKGNAIRFKGSDGEEYWKEYDDKGNAIYYKDSDGYEHWTEYDDKGNAIHFKDSEGKERWYEYDEKGNVIHYKNSGGYEHWTEYDDKGNEIHSKDSEGKERWTEYDDKGNEIHSKDSDGKERWTEYDDKGNEIHFKGSDGEEYWKEYDDKGNAIYYKDSDGEEYWKEYDDKGNLIHFKDSNGDERWKEFDEKGNEIHFKDSDGEEYWKEYDDKGNVIHYKDSNGFERSSTVEYVSKEQYLQEKTNSTQEEQESQMYKKIHTKDSTGFEEWKEYDEKGNEIHVKNNLDDEEWKEYDDKGNVIHYKDSDGFKEWYEYDNKGKLIHSKDSDGYEEWSEYDYKGNEIYLKDSEGFEVWKEYDNKGKLIHSKDSDGFESWRECDDKGNVIHYKDSYGNEEWNKYDEKGNQIHYKHSNGLERWREYDEKGYEIHSKDSFGHENWYEYDDKGNVIHSKDSTGYATWTEYDEKGNQIHFKNSDDYEHWTEYDDKGNVIHFKNSKDFESLTTVEYLTKEQYLQEKIEQAKKDGYEAGYLFDNDESIISWNELKKIDSIFSDANFIDVIDEIKESNTNLSEKELKEEVVFRVLEDNVDWHGFDHSLIDNEQIDSGKLLDSRCYILEQVSESVVENKINSLENIQNKIDELLLKDSRAKDFFIMDCIKSEINKDFDFWQEIDCDPKGNVNDTIGSYQFLAGISDEVAKKLGLDLRDEKEKLNFQYEILGTYEKIPEKYTESDKPFIRFDNREIDFCCNISSDDNSFMKQEIFSFDFYDSNYSYDILYKCFDNLVASAMEQTQEYELFLNNPQEYVEKCVLSIVAPTIPSIEPMKILEEISKEKSNTENDFRNMLFEKMKTSKDPFEATSRIFEELKQKKDTERIEQFKKYLEDNNCKTKEGYEKFFIEIIGLTKNEPQKKHKREFNGFHGIER